MVELVDHRKTIKQVFIEYDSNIRRSCDSLPFAICALNRNSYTIYYISLNGH